MSIFNELVLPKLIEISNEITKNFNDDLKAALECFDKFEEEFLNGKGRTRETLKDKNATTTLQSINEDEDESVKSTEKSNSTDRTSTESTERRGSKKRSKHEVDGIESPEVEKRQKRNASIKAQSIITKQVNVNLMQKMRREGSLEKSGKGRRRKEDDKENAEPLPVIQIKQEKISIPPEPMKVEQEDEIAMPPPAAPVPKPRKALQKEKEKEVEPVEEQGSRRRTTRTRKQTDSLPPQSASNRSTRASSRATRQNEEVPPAETRPKRTRAKKVADTSTTDSEKGSQENGAASPAEKPPKRTRRAQKAAEKDQEKEVEKPQEPEKPQKEVQQEEIQQTQQSVLLISPKKERISVPEPEIQSPVLQKIKKNNDKTKDNSNKTKTTIQTNVKNEETVSTNKDEETPNVLDKMNVINQIASESNNMDKTVVLPNGVYNHTPVSPKNVRQMNETMVLEKCNQTVVLDKPTNVIMDATVVIDKDPKGRKLTEDNSLLTDDESLEHTPPKQPPVLQPTSAVKEKVQQFEEMATRVTRTKTRAMAKKEDQTENQTPPDKISKAVLSSDTLTKMNNLIFNGKTPQISTSATKPRANTNTKTMIPSSTSKLSGLRTKEEERIEKEDARRKKEALLEAKREMQKKKREEKMAAAAAAREAAERERRALLQAAARERLEKQAHADMGKMERLREVERRKQELARKAAETEERRRAEEAARRQRLADDLRRADDRARQLEEAEAMKKEAAIMAREIERRQREFMEKQKMKQRMEGDKTVSALKGHGHPPPEPVYMADGFQYLNSDEDEDAPERVPPPWCISKVRRKQLCIQACIPPNHIDKLFSVREHSPDLSEIFPNIEKNRLKRTSSAVWRTPPRLPTLKE